MKDEVQIEDPVLLIAKEVPNYRGYENDENVGSTDRVIRRYLLEKLNEIGEKFAQKKEKYLEQHENFSHETLKNIGMSISALRASLQNPCYCSNGKIVTRNLTQEQSLQLRDYDSQLFEQIHILEDEVNHMRVDISSDEFLDHLNVVYDLVDGFNQLLTEREFVFLNNEQ